MVGRRLAYLASLLGCLVFYYFYREWFSWFALMAILWLPVLSLILSLPAVFTTRGGISCPDTIPVGEAGCAALTAVCPLPAPPFRGKLRVTHAITGETRTLKFKETLPTELCGQLKLEAVRCRILDYLGLFRLPMRGNPAAQVLIWPKSVPIAQVPDFARLPARFWKPKPGGGFAENHELRLYRPGDSLQQIHWKLSAKTGKLILREAMEPIHRRVRLTIDLYGTAEALNRKLGQLLWLGQLLLNHNLPYEIAALTGQGVLTWNVDSESALRTALAELLSAPAATAGSLQSEPSPAHRQYHIGGDGNED